MSTIPDTRRCLRKILIKTLSTLDDSRGSSVSGFDIHRRPTLGSRN